MFQDVREMEIIDGKNKKQGNGDRLEDNRGEGYWKELDQAVYNLLWNEWMIDLVGVNRVIWESEFEDLYVFSTVGVKQRPSYDALKGGFQNDQGLINVDEVDCEVKVGKDVFGNWKAELISIRSRNTLL